MSTEARVQSSPAGLVTYRRATEADVPGEHEVFVAAESQLLDRHGFSWPTRPPLEALAPSLRHLIRHDGERCLVAEADGRIVGYSTGIIRGGWWFLAALFIDPGFQGRGVGRTLLEGAMRGAPARRMTITDSIQPISIALYGKHGLLPITPVLGFEGSATRGDVTGGDTTGLIAASPDPAALLALDQAAYGFDRAVDHAFWASQAQPTLWLRDGAPVAYSYRWPGGKIGPLAGLDETSAGDALLAELDRRPDAAITIPGTARALVRTALASGLRLGAPPGILHVSEGFEPPRSLAIASYGLM
jgi:GNAT superfamily N-acetyltransferase